MEQDLSHLIIIVLRSSPAKRGRPSVAEKSTRTWMKQSTNNLWCQRKVDLGFVSRKMRICRATTVESENENDVMVATAGHRTKIAQDHDTSLTLGNTVRVFLTDWRLFAQSECHHHA